MYYKNVILFFLLISLSLISFSQKRNPIFYSESNHWVDSIMLTLTEEERLGQLFMIAAYSNKGDVHEKEITRLIQEYNIGGVMFLKGSPTKQASLTNYYQSISKTPLMIAIDAEWGLAMRLDSILSFPWQMTLGATRDEELIYSMGKEIARQCKLIGVNINFSPVADINFNPQNPIINNRSFGENVQKVSKLALAYMKGMQDNNLLACAKHFPGHGDTDVDSHKSLPIIKHSRYRLIQTELSPFRKLINEGLGSIMVGHLHVPSLDPTPDLPATLSPKIINNLLKKEMGFGGLVITDALNMKGVSNFASDGEVDLQALIAGNDVLLMSKDVSKAIELIKDAIKKNIITQSDIDEICRKILLAKYWMGLHNYRSVNLDSLVPKITNNDTKVLNKRLIASSLTLLQNYHDLLPLKRLDTLKIASLSIGEDGSYFQKTLNKYAAVKQFHISEKADQKEQAVLLNKLSKYNLVIVGIHKSNDSAWEDYKIDRNIDIFLQTLAIQSKVVVSVFTNPYSVNSFLLVDNFDSFLLGYQNSKVAQELTAQAIFGGISFSGELPVSTKHFSCFSGIETDTIRMRYVMPEEVENLDLLQLYKIDSLVYNAIGKDAIPGCQILISKNGNIFFHKSYGYHTYDKKILVKDEDIYDLASITKIIATLPSLMKMVDDNQLDLDNKLGDLIELGGTNKSDLIHRDILTHQSGLLSWIPFYKETLQEDAISGFLKLRDTLYANQESVLFPHKVAEDIFLHHSYPDSIFKKILDSEILDKGYRYSDLGYYIYKYIIEENHNISLDLYTRDKFFSKLGMENLGYLPKERIENQRIIPTENDIEFRGQLISGYVHDMGAAMQGGVGGHAGVFSNANDLAKFMQMYLQQGKYADEEYISSSTVKEFTRCQFCEEDNRRGLGFDKPALVENEGVASNNVASESFGHSGFTGTLAWADPKTQVVYIFLSNRIHPTSANKGLIDMNVRTNIMEVIFNSINE